MALDPKKLEEWKRLAEAATHGTPCWDDLAPADQAFMRAAREAVPALLAEVERLQADAREADRARELVAAAHPLPASSLNGAVAFLLARWRENDGLRSLLREVEWEGRATVFRRAAPPLSLVGCPLCHGEAKPSPLHHGYVGHEPGCRLAAAIREGQP